MTNKNESVNINSINISHTFPFNLKNLPPPFAVFNKMEHMYPLKYPNPKKDILSIIGIPSTEECRIYSQGGKPVIISDMASSHYGIASLQELVGKPVMIFRRYRTDDGKYEEPWRWHTYRVTVKEFKNLGRLDLALAITEGARGEEHILINRVCIDWDYVSC
jgi:hypothetical protein